MTLPTPTAQGIAGTEPRPDARVALYDGPPALQLYRSDSRRVGELREREVARAFRRRRTPLPACLVVAEVRMDLLGSDAEDLARLIADGIADARRGLVLSTVPCRDCGERDRHAPDCPLNPTRGGTA